MLHRRISFIQYPIRKTPLERGLTLGAQLGALQFELIELLAVWDRSYLCVNYADELAILRAFTLKFYKPVFFGEQCVIAPKTDISARMDTSATLTNDDISSNNCLAAIDFNAKAFTFRIATVPSTTACFFMCHCTVPICFSTSPPLGRGLR